MRIICFDPGPHTGVAVFEQWGERISHRTVTVPGKKLTLDTYLDLASILAQHTAETVDYGSSVGPINLAPLRPISYAPVVVIERFHTASVAVGATWSGTITSMLCGFLDGQAQLMGLRVVWQNPAERKPFQEQAKAMPYSDDHQVSATAHGLCYLTRQGLVAIHTNRTSRVPVGAR